MNRLITLLLLFALLGCTNSRSINNQPIVETDSLYKEIARLQKEIEHLKANFKTLANDLYVDSPRYREMTLSGGYSVCFYPQREYYNERLEIYYSYMLKGGGMNKVLKGWFREEEFVDFKNHFILFGVQGQPIEFYLYEKKTGELLLHASALQADVENESFIYLDYPDGDDKNYIYDLNTGNKTLLALPDKVKYPWVTHGNAYESVFIKEKRNGYYILSSTEDKSCEFKVRFR